MKNNPILNFGLVFDDDFSSDLVNASQSIQKQIHLEYVLGEKSLPHVTILQFSAETAEIRAAQLLALAALGARAYVNAIATQYEPHATLAAWQRQESLPSFEISSAILDRKKVRGYFSLGISGPRFQYESILIREPRT